MECWNGADLARSGVKCEPAPARPGDSFPGVEQRLCGGIAQAYQDIRVCKFDLAQRKRQANGGFLWGWRTVPGGSPGHDVGDVRGLPVKPNGRQHAIQELAGAADERQPGNVLVTPGSLADEHHPRFRVSIGEDKLSCSGSQCTAFEAKQDFPQLFKASRASCHLARSPSGRLRRDRGCTARGWCGGCIAWGRRKAKACIARRRSTRNDALQACCTWRLDLRQTVDRVLTDQIVHARFLIERKQRAQRLLVTVSHCLSIRLLSELINFHTFTSDCSHFVQIACDLQERG